jgi:hypothetical protein
VFTLPTPTPYPPLQESALSAAASSNRPFTPVRLPKSAVLVEQPVDVPPPRFNSVWPYAAIDGNALQSPNSKVVDVAAMESTTIGANTGDKRNVTYTIRQRQLCSPSGVEGSDSDRDEEDEETQVVHMSGGRMVPPTELPVSMMSIQEKRRYLKLLQEQGFYETGGSGEVSER